ncbi:MinD/ParA family protein [Paraburkholderia sp. IMGN_8]|uniref:MinD/ParA family ATP-binding protein n=1 Tax=Paraburkholderia sp. IMGN_8 TaxID=3136564 RepID=UPI003101A205
MKNIVSGHALELGQMLAENAARVIAVTAGPEGVGRTAAVVNLAIALTRQGMNVLVVDECRDERSASAMLAAIQSADESASAVHRKLPRVLAVDSRPGQFTSTSAVHGDREDFAGLQYGAVDGNTPDIVLIDATLDTNGALSPLALQAQHIVVVMRLSADAAADTYVCMKRLRLAQGIEEFRVIVSLLDDEADTHSVLESLEVLARDYLAVSVLDAGSISNDPRTTQAAELSRCVTDAFPACPGGSDFARLAADMLSWPRLPAASRRPPATAYMPATRTVHASTFALNGRVPVNACRSISPTQQELPEADVYSLYAPFMKTRRILPGAKASERSLSMQSER